MTCSVLLYSVYEPNLLTKEPYFLRLTYLSFKSVICIYWFIFPLMKNKGGRPHTSNSLHGRGSLPRHLSAPRALFSAILLFTSKPGVPALLGACCREKWHCLPLEAAEEEPPPPISYCCLKCHGCCGSLGGLWRREEISLLSFCFVCAAPGIWVWSRPGHVSIAIVQIISSANCMLSGSRGML